MKIRGIALFAVLLGMAVGVQAAPPIGDTIWLHNDSTGSYVIDSSGILVALNTTDIGSAENFVVEDADGSGSNILLKAVSSGLYVKADTSSLDRLKPIATAGETSDTLTHFTWTEISGGIALVCVGDTDGTPVVGIGGGAMQLRSVRSSTGNADAKFIFGVVGGGITPPAGVNAIGYDSLVQLDWDDDVSGLLDFYTVYRSTSAGVTTNDVLTNVTASAYADADVINDTNYYYAVTATDTNGNPSELSDEVSATPIFISTNVVLFQHIDASVAASVQTNASEGVTNVVDQSGNGNDAVDGPGTDVLWPSASVSGSGLSGFDVRTNRATLNLTPNAASFLDFSGDAAGNSGFAVLVAFKADSILSGSTRNMVIGNNGSTSTGFQMRYDDGIMEAHLGGVKIEKDALELVEAGDTMVFALNYAANSGEMVFWDSKNNNASTNTTAVFGNFSTNTADDTLRIAGSGNGDQYMDGMVGEVQVYSSLLTAAEFEARRDALAQKWGAFQPQNLSATGVDSAVFLNWDDYLVDEVDYYTVYRSTTSGLTTNDAVTNVTETTYLDQGLVNGSEYFYAVSATDTNGGLSGLSAEASATPVEASTNVVLIQHIDATVGGSVSLSNVNEVVGVADQSGSGNDALADSGTVLYPSASLSENGLAGLDMGTTRNTLELFSDTECKEWLDFAGAASTNNGFAVFVAFKADTVATTGFQPVIANTGGALQDGSFGMRFVENGDMVAFLDGVSLRKNLLAPVASGDTVVFAMNYEALSGAFEFWDSKNGSSITTNTTPYGNFTQDGKEILLGGSANGGQIFDGMIGEVKIYSSKLSASEFAAECAALTTTWVTAVASGYDVWASAWGVNLGDGDGDFDADNVANLAEYALNGNPTNGFDDTETELANDGGLVYIHAQHKTDGDLVYTVETRDMLQSGSWTNEGYTSVIGTNDVVAGDYNYVSNAVPTTDDVKFIHVKIED